MSCHKLSLLILEWSETSGYQGDHLDSENWLPIHFTSTSTMDVKRTWNTAEKPFQIIVTYDSTPGNNVWIGFGLIPSFPPLPAKRNLSNENGDGNEDRKRQYATCTSPPYLPPKFCISIVFNFNFNFPGEVKNKGYAKFGGQIKCIMGDVQVAYRFRLAKQQLRTCITLFCTFLCCRCTTTT